MSRRFACKCEAWLAQSLAKHLAEAGLLYSVSHELGPWFIVRTPHSVQAGATGSLTPTSQVHRINQSDKEWFSDSLLVIEPEAKVLLLLK